MYRGCCIEWDCLMMHRIKSVAFSWAPLSPSLFLFLSYTPLPLPPSPSLSHTHWLPASSFLPFLSPLFSFNPHPPSSSSPTSLFPSHAGCLGLLATRCSVYCCLTPSITTKGEEESVWREGDKKNKNKIWLGKKKWARWKQTLYRNSFRKLEGKWVNEWEEHLDTFNDPPRAPTVQITAWKLREYMDVIVLFLALAMMILCWDLRQ